MWKREATTIVCMATIFFVGQSTCQNAEQGNEMIVPSLSSPPTRPPSEDLPRLEPCRDPSRAAASSDFDADTGVFYLLYTRRNPTIAQRLLTLRRYFPSSHFSAHRPTKILIHGWVGSIRSPNYRLMTVIRETYLAVSDVNVIFVDWSRKSSKTYLHASGNTVAAGLALGRFIETLIEVGASPSSIHLIGHSLGAHVAGIAGFLVSEEMAIGRITGLDPAGWLFEVPKLQPAHLRLSSSAADFVDVIHTTGGLTGLGVGCSTPMGHADFYANRGEAPQPGCHRAHSLGCSHARAILLFAESIRTPMAFLATKCAGWPRFEDGSCNSNRRALMGDGAHKGLRGLYFLRTNFRQPYGLGNAGSVNIRHQFPRLDTPSDGRMADDL